MMLLAHILCCLAHAQIGESSLNDILHHYETLRSSHVQHTRALHRRGIFFKAFGRNFFLHLRKSNGVLSSDFKSYRVNQDGSREEINVNKYSFYKGHVHQISPSSVLMHIDQNNFMTGLIRLEEEVFHVEPSWRHDGSKNEHIIYRAADVHSNITRMYRQKRKDGASYHSNGGKKHRSRRRADCDLRPANVCPLYLVADHLYFRHVGGGDFESTVRYMLQAVTVADNIFSNTQWRSSNDLCFNIGFSVKRVFVYQSPSNSTGPRFNQPLKDDNLNNEKLLRFLIKDESGISDKNICLGHLFTYRDFADGVVGLAFIRSDDGTSGICSQQNVALSSNLNFGRPLLTLEANLVTSHELAHNFGAKHDGLDDSDGCSPGVESEAGNYLMYERLLSGEKDNNDKLSTCSIKQIANLLEKLPPNCLVPRNGTFCGNGIVEEDEQCDGGIINMRDPCCTKDCRLKNEKFQCSDINHICCSNCVFSSTSKKCRDRNEFNCTGDTFCDGKSAGCPDHYKRLVDKSPCNFGRGNCLKSGCVDVCKQKGMDQCHTGKTSNLCHVWCKDRTSKTCSVLLMNGKKIQEPNGTLCDSRKGLCVDGTCQPIKKNVEAEFEALLDHFTFSKLGQFLQANIVGTILTFSLLIWVPASCIVHFLDKQQDEEDFIVSRWMHPNNVQLLPKQSKKFKELFKKNNSKRVSGARFHISS